MARTIDSSGLTGFTVPGGKLVKSVASNYCTIALKTVAGNDPSPTDPLLVAMRTDASSGASFEGRYLTTPLSITLHTKFGVYVDNQPFRIWLLLIDDAGTFRIGAVNCSGTDNTQYRRFFTALDEWAPISSTLEGIGDPVIGLGGVVYTNTVAVTSKPFRILGFVTFSAGQPAAGVYTLEPDVVQMFGPNLKKPGELVQSNSFFSPEATAITSAIPWDNTIPQKTEGDELFGGPLAFTAQSPANWIEHDLLLQIGAGANPSRVIAALFQDSGSDAIAAGAHDVAGTGQTQLRLLARILARSQSTSFGVRAGMDTAFNATATAALNGSNAAAKFNGTMQSGYVVKELMG